MSSLQLLIFGIGLGIPVGILIDRVLLALAESHVLDEWR